MYRKGIPFIAPWPQVGQGVVGWSWFSIAISNPARSTCEVLNAIRYMTRSGGDWRMLPKDFPPWQRVYWWFRRFVRLMLFRTIHDIALMIDRDRVGRETSPSAGIC